jgi:hypothetical protein
MRTLICLSVLVLLVSSVAGFADAGWMGNSSQGTYWTNSAWTSGSSTSSGNWFNAASSSWVPASGNSDETPLSVDAYVELYCQRTQQTQATFHFGIAPFTAQTAHVTGTLVENHPCWIGVSKANWTQDNSHSLTFDAAGSYAGAHPNNDGNLAYPTNDATTAIPITWNLQVAGTLKPMVWNTGLNQVNGGWYSDGRMPVGTVPYEIQITATPAQYQADGHYTLDPDVVVLPDM